MFFNFLDKWYYLWKYLRFKYFIFLDYIIIRRFDLRDFCSIRVMRGVECCIDYFMICVKCNIKLKFFFLKKKGLKFFKKLNVEKLKN